MLTETKRYNIQVEGTRSEGDVKLVEAAEGNLVYYYEAQVKVDRLNAQIASLQRRLAELGEVEIDLHAKIIKLEDEARGPEPFATWQEAAVSERMKRMDVNKTVRELTARDEEAKQLVARWIEPRENHSWIGFQKRVEKFLGVNQPEQIPPGITWRGEQGNFYDVHNKGQGQEFMTKWYDRRQEFPAYRRDCIGTWP